MQVFSGVCRVRFGVIFASRETSLAATPRMDNDGSLRRVAPVDQKPRPKSERWPLKTLQSRQKPEPAVQVGVQGTKGPARETSARKSRFGPGRSPREGQENALEVVSDSEGPAVEAIRAELKTVQSAVSVPTLDVRIQQCDLFISRSERRLAEIDAQRVAEEESLTEARATLERLRSRAMRSRVALVVVSPDAEDELTRLRAQVAEVQRAAVERSERGGSFRQCPHSSQQSWTIR